MGRRSFVFQSNFPTGVALALWFKKWIILGTLEALLQLAQEEKSRKRSVAFP
jgi:hypothetical protein